MIMIMIMIMAQKLILRHNLSYCVIIIYFLYYRSSKLPNIKSHKHYSKKSESKLLSIQIIIYHNGSLSSRKIVFRIKLSAGANDNFKPSCDCDISF